MNETPKITSVIDLAQHKVGAVLYRVVFRRVGQKVVQIPPGEEWMIDVHPKVLFERGIATKSWKFRCVPPRLCGIDFQYVIEILTSEPVVERFEVVEIARSEHTGEFYYSDANGDWMPEDSLFTTAVQARREKARIKNLFKQWVDRTATDEV